ncbi:4Fe-4S binding protein [Bacillus sp. B-jedd]|uniref:4Fe-4S binding protein n=1 Tax=Bacillus sp. B-jedd TaxID=1476857 RepID=UPI00051562BD|nr:4Fe-4S binding protein [Bacillus sp. B-jedd]CEG26878.1 Electron transport complex subunit RsxB [Bacillus sp. B-jedd]
MGMLTNWLESLAYEIEISSACLRLQSPKSGCMKCGQYCPEKAITFTGREVKIDSESCTNCGQCVPACPVQAISGKSPERTIVNDTLLIEEGLFPPFQELLYFCKRGIRKIYCSNQVVPDAPVIDEVQSLLGEMGFEPIAILDSLPSPAEERVATRRSFLLNAASEGRKLAAASFAPAKWKFNQDQFNLVSMFPGFSLYEVHISQERCTLCEACFKMCKQEVFMLQDGILSVKHSSCNGCKLCTDVCTAGAVNPVQKAHSSEKMELGVERVACRDCSSPFYTWRSSNSNTDAKCPVCKTRSEKGYLNPFGD